MPSARMPPLFCLLKGGRAGTSGSGGGSIAAPRALPFWTATVMGRHESNTTSILPIPMRGGILARFPSGQFTRSRSRRLWKRWKTVLVRWKARRIWVLPFFRLHPMSWRTTSRITWRSSFIIRKAAFWSRWMRNLWKPSSSPCFKTALGICCWCAAVLILLSILPRRTSAISAVSIPCRPSTHWVRPPATFPRCACPKSPARCCPCRGNKIAHLKMQPQRSML